jgi:hypothetical protein
MKGHGKRGAVCDRALKVISAGLEVKAVHARAIRLRRLSDVRGLSTLLTNIHVSEIMSA